MDRWKKWLGSLVWGIGIIALVSGCSSWKKKEEPHFSALRFFQQGNATFAQMDYHQAIINYHKAIEMDDQTAEFHYNLGLAYFHVEKYKKSLTAFENASQLAPRMAGTYYNVALIYNKLYETDKAHKFYNKYQSLMVKQKAQQLQSQTAQQPSRAKTKTAAKSKSAPIKSGKKQAKATASSSLKKKNIKPIPRPKKKGKKRT